MGYEVLDAGGARDGGGAGLAPIDVVALDDLPDPAGPSGRPPGRPRIPPWARRAAARLTPVLAVVLVAALSLGLAGGAWFAHRRSVSVQEAAARSTVSAFALAVGFDGDVGTDEQTVGTVAVRVFNVGGRSLSIAAAQGVGALVDTASRVTVITGDGLVQPGRDALVRVRVPVHCDAPTAVHLSVPVRSPDGTLHELPVRDTDQGVLTQVSQAVCARTEPIDPVSVQLVGTLSRPVLQVTNASDRPVTVGLAEGSALMPTASMHLTLTPEPALPVTVPARGSRQVALRLQVRGCHRDLAALADGGAGYFGLQIQGPEELNQMGVDVSAIVGAALERACR